MPAEQAKPPNINATNADDEFKSPEFEIGPSIQWNLLCYPNGKIDENEYENDKFDNEK